MHGFAAGTYPVLKNLQPQQFASLLSTSEIVVGTALLIPFVPTAVAGAALTVFSGGLLGIGIGLLTRGTIDRPQPRRIRKAAKKVARAEAKARSPRKRNIGG